MMKMTKDNPAQILRQTRQLPIIGIVGATRPGRDYVSNLGYETGYELRKYVEQRGGTLFTGGVEGVGVDAYVGVLKFCLEPDGRVKDDRFFVLVPAFQSINTRLGTKRFDYEIPASYSALAHLGPRGVLDSFVIDGDMEDRRRYVGEVADALVVINGSGGTLDETFQAVR